MKYPKKPAKPKKEKLNVLKKKLQDVFNKYIRLRDGKCCTCGCCTTLNASHYWSVGKGGCSPVRFDERNVHAQCYTCHMEYHHEPTFRYYNFMMGLLGQEGYEKLQLDAHTPIKRQAEWYHEKIDYYRKKVEAMQ